MTDLENLQKKEHQLELEEDAREEEICKQITDLFVQLSQLAQVQLLDRLAQEFVEDEDE